MRVVAYDNGIWLFCQHPFFCKNPPDRRIRDLLFSRPLGHGDYARVIDDDLFDQCTDVIPEAVLADNHPERPSIPINVHEIRLFAVFELVDTPMEAGLAEADFVRVVLLFSHILAEKSGYHIR